MAFAARFHRQMMMGGMLSATADDVLAAAYRLGTGTGGLSNGRSADVTHATKQNKCDACCR